jgi:hypothetical protein
MAPRQTLFEWKLSLGYFQHQLTKIFSVKQLDQRLREGLDACYDIFFALHATVFQIASHLGNGQVVAVGVVEYDDAFHAGTVDQQAQVIFGALHSGGVVVLADSAADDDAGLAVDAGEYGV